MRNKSHNPIYAKATLEFVTVSAEYCRVLEQCSGCNRKELLDDLLQLLPLLYFKVRQLPQLDTEGDFVPDDQVTEEDYNWVRNNVAEILGTDDEYEEILAEQMQTEDVQWCTISEGLADIYQALRNFVSAYQQRVEECMMDALWNVKDNFELYWGATLLSTLKRIHYLSTSIDEA